MNSKIHKIQTRTGYQKVSKKIKALAIIALALVILFFNSPAGVALAGWGWRGH